MLMDVPSNEDSADSHPKSRAFAAPDPAEEKIPALT
jgi:hypothetical protein